MNLNNQQELKNYISQKTGREDIRILEQNSGFHNENIIAKTSKGKIVVRINKKTDSSGSLKRERTILEFLHYKNTTYVPYPINYDEKREILIESFIGEKEADIRRLDKQEIKKWISNISDVQGLNFEEYQKFAEQKNYQIEDLNSLEYILNGFGSNKFDKTPEILNEEGIELYKWAKNQIEEFSYPVSSKNRYLIHGDIVHSTRRTKDQFYFIDWEFAKFVPDPEITLSQLFVNLDLSTQREKLLTDLYVKNTDKEDIDEVVRKGKEFFILGNIRWNLSQAVENKVKGTAYRKYLKNAFENKAKYESNMK